MDDREKKMLIDLYEKRLDNYGIDVKTVGWRSITQQLVRFEALSQIGDLNNKTLLDVGCGFGDLYDFLLNKNIKLSLYKGIDLSEKMINNANKLHSGIKGTNFEVLDLLKGNNDDKLREKYDYVVASGIFSFPIKENVNHLKNMIQIMFRICSIGVAINMPTSYVDYKDDNLFYFAPEEIFRFCKSLTKRVTLRHDYMPYEFTLYLYKDEEIDKDNVFIEFRTNSRINSYHKQ